jgi:hypothetical protein
MNKKEALQKRRLLNLEIDTLTSMENELREQIRELALRAVEVQRERMAKVEQLAKLNMTTIYDARKPYKKMIIGGKVNIPSNACRNYTTDQLLEFAFTLLDRARREQAGERLPINDNWLADNLTLEIIRAKVIANRANATISV